MKKLLMAVLMSFVGLLCFAEPIDDYWVKIKEEVSTSFNTKKNYIDPSLIGAGTTGDCYVVKEGMTASILRMKKRYTPHRFIANKNNEVESIELYSYLALDPYSLSSKVVPINHSRVTGLRLSNAFVVEGDICYGFLYSTRSDTYYLFIVEKDSKTFKEAITALLNNDSLRTRASR